MVGFTALTELHGDDAAADLATRFAAEVAAMAAEHGAELVKALGDAVMVRADRCADALQLGLRLQSERSATLGFPPIRAGMHTGSAVERAGDWFGAAVNVASRVAASARGGELLMTEPSVAAAGRMKGMSIESLGPQLFRNVSSPVGVYSVRAASQTQSEAPATQQPRFVPSLVPLPVPATG